eukprot:TRINITY_DN2365_c2_g1_i1.p1 TRINITY_DN2365_c2_g1~~TRINITY_DN2365_c2_g1_i1.p1  ORF type:complete len:705 (+),score=256.48 TRINITY_DN2365_c2_g1_i1:42-2156(+)
MAEAQEYACANSLGNIVRVVENKPGSTPGLHPSSSSGVESEDDSSLSSLADPPSVKDSPRGDSAAAIGSSDAEENMPPVLVDSVAEVAARDSEKLPLKKQSKKKKFGSKASSPRCPEPDSAGLLPNEVPDSSSSSSSSSSSASSSSPDALLAAVNAASFSSSSSTSSASASSSSLSAFSSAPAPASSSSSLPSTPTSTSTSTSTTSETIDPAPSTPLADADSSSHSSSSSSKSKRRSSSSTSKHKSSSHSKRRSASTSSSSSSFPSDSRERAESTGAAVHSKKSRKRKKSTNRVKRNKSVSHPEDSSETALEDGAAYAATSSASCGPRLHSSDGALPGSTTDTRNQVPQDHMRSEAKACARLGVGPDEMSSAYEEAERARMESVERALEQEREKRDAALLRSSGSATGKAQQMLGVDSSVQKAAAKLGVSGEEMDRAKVDAEAARAEAKERQISHEREKHDKDALRSRRGTKANRVLGAEAADMKVQQRLGLCGDDLEKAKKESEEARRDAEERAREQERAELDQKLLEQHRASKAAKMLGSDCSDRKVMQQLGVAEGELDDVKGSALRAQQEAVEEQMAQDREAFDENLMRSKEVRASKAAKVLGEDTADRKLRQMLGVTDDSKLEKAKEESARARAESMELAIQEERRKLSMEQAQNKRQATKAFAMLGEHPVGSKVQRVLGMSNTDYYAAIETLKSRDHDK